MSKPDREAMLDRDHAVLSIRRQCSLLSLARSGVYRSKRAANDDADLALMRRIDELFTKWPFYGSRRMAVTLGGGTCRQPQARAAADADHGHCGARAEAEYLEAGAGAQDLSVSSA
jgi:putative transposase